MYDNIVSSTAKSAPTSSKRKSISYDDMEVLVSLRADTSDDMAIK